MTTKGTHDPDRRSTLDRKLDPHGRRRLSRGELAGNVDLMVRTETEMTPDEQATLCDAGVEIHFVTGNVLSGAAPAESLAAVAELPFVRRIELSRVLFGEDEKT